MNNDPAAKVEPFGLVTTWSWWFGKSCWKCGPDVTDGLKASKSQVEQRFNHQKQTAPERAAEATVREIDLTKMQLRYDGHDLVPPEGAKTGNGGQ